ncbi:hypothetical protein ACS0TY_015237 [Phlomoides rotata]
MIKVIEVGYFLHIVIHERTEEVNKALLELIKASEIITITYNWTNLFVKSSELNSHSSNCVQ